MDLTEFKQLVRDMREQQRKFFASEYGSAERREALAAARPLERQVDAVLDQPEDGGLFAEEPS